MSVLVVDDDLPNLDAIEAILSPLGRTLVRATSGKEALRHCLERDFAVIIMDVRMPGLDGFQTAEIIRSRERSRATPIIFLTASDHSDVGVARGYETGAVDYLVKPAQPHVLRAKVAVFVELHERTRALKERERELRELEARSHQREVEATERRERERADQAIRQVLERQALILRSAPLIVFTMEAGAPFALTWISDNVRALTGYDADTFLATPDFWASRVHPEDRERALGIFSAPKIDALNSVELRWQGADGTYLWFLSQFLVSSREGRTELIGTALDITDHHRAQEALLESERQFRQAQKMEAIGRLAGGVAHDFNNLLSVVLGYGQFVLESLGPDDPARADAQEIMKVGARAAALTRQLLAFSRQQILTPRVLDLNQIVQGVQSLLRPLIGEDIELRTTTGDAPALVKADPGQIEQVLMNLAVNARDAMPTGGQIRIDVGRSAADVVLSLSDTGCGMDEETQARVFEPFFTTKESGKGTGLGLSTVYGIVQQSGGRIGLESAVGRGTTFRISLPLVADATEPEQEMCTLSPTRTGSETILLAEDDLHLREIERSMLVRMGYFVLAAEDGAVALEIADRHDGPIDLLLTDVVMPTMGGQELAARLAERRPGLKVLYLSGYTDRGITEADLALPGRVFLQKPFTPDTLALRVRQLLDEPTRGAGSGS